MANGHEIRVNISDDNNQLPLENAVVPHENVVPGLNNQELNVQLGATDILSGIYNLLILCATFQGAIMAAVFSMQPLRHDIWWSPVTLSAATSVGMLGVLAAIYYEEFNSRRRRANNLRNFLMENWIWIVKKTAILMVLLVIALILLFSYIRLLRDPQP